MRISFLNPRWPANLSGHAKAACLLLALGFSLHAFHLRAILDLAGHSALNPMEMPDTNSYVSNADAMLHGGHLAPVFRERPLVPAILAGIHLLHMREECFLLLPLAMHLPAAWAVGFLAAWRSGRRGARLLGIASYFLAPAIYRYGVQISTDVLHVQLVLCAVACTVAWGQNPTWRRVATALGLWGLAQLARPTFFAAPALCVFLVPPAVWRSPARVRALALLAGLAVIPLSFSLANYFTYGIFSPTLSQAESGHRNVVARIRALQQNERQPDRLSKLFFEEREVVAVSDPDWQALQLYGTKGETKDFALHYRRLQDNTRSFNAANRAWMIDSSIMEIVHQFSQPPLLRWPMTGVIPDLPFEAGLAPRLHKTMLLLALVSLITFLRIRPGFTLFVLLTTAMVVLSCSFLWWESQRIRLPVEMLCAPVIAASLLRWRTYAALATGLLAYGAGRLLPLPSAIKTAAVVLASLVPVFLSGSNSRKGEPCHD